MSAFHARIAEPLLWLGLGLLVALAALWTLDVCGVDAKPRLLDYDEDSYLQVAEQIARADQIPQAGMRPLLYPGVLAFFLATDRDAALSRVVELQRIAWVASAVLVFLATALLCRRPFLSACTGLLFMSMAEPLWLVRLIYAETVASVLALLALVFFALAAKESARSWLLVGSALTAAGAAHSRPIFQILLVIFAALMLAETGRSLRERLGGAAPFVAAGVLTLGPFYAYNALERGGLYFVKMGHLGLVNYIGDRRLLGHFPPELDYVEEIYETYFRANPGVDRAPWWKVLPQWQSAEEARGGPRLAREQFGVRAGGEAMRILAANPGFYASRWRETWSAFSRSTNAAKLPGACPARFTSRGWSEFWSGTGAWLPLALLVVQIALWMRSTPRRPVAELAPITIYVAIALANTAIEPWGGQVRYRAPLQAFLLIALAVAAASASDRLRGAEFPSRG